jgi:carbon storage regulator
MLLLNRKRGERILLSGGISLVVVEIRGAQVRIGIEAPRDVKIAREEIAPGILPDPTARIGEML